MLAEYGFDLDYVKGALRWCLAFNDIRFFGDLMQLCSEIAGSERSDNFTHRTALVMWVFTYLGRLRYPTGQWHDGGAEDLHAGKGHEA